MGFETNRFEDIVDEELICAICSFILEDPVQAPKCEHAFCSLCISHWLKHQSICPIDRTPIDEKELKPVPRILKNLLSKLRLKCDFEPHGCQAVIRLESLPIHRQECDYNPKKPIICKQGCNIIVAKDELKSHNCIKELRKIIDDQQFKINQLSTELMMQKNDLNVYINELRSLKSYASRCFRMTTNANSNLGHSNLNLSGEDILFNFNNLDFSNNLLQLNQEENEILEWSCTLTLAKVTRWGGIISTPDSILQNVIKRALTECHCPLSILNQLMENTHERQWPSGLNTLESRQINRNHYTNYVCKRVPQKQAVLILACDNKHMPSHLVLEPGIILIFAHGVE